MPSLLQIVLQAVLLQLPKTQVDSPHVLYDQRRNRILIGKGTTVLVLRRLEPYDSGDPGTITGEPPNQVRVGYVPPSGDIESEKWGDGFKLHFQNADGDSTPGDKVIGGVPLAHIEVSQWWQDVVDSQLIKDQKAETDADDFRLEQAKSALEILRSLEAPSG